MFLLHDVSNRGRKENESNIPQTEKKMIYRNVGRHFSPAHLSECVLLRRTLQGQWKKLSTSRAIQIEYKYYGRVLSHAPSN